MKASSWGHTLREGVLVIIAYASLPVVIVGLYVFVPVLIVGLELEERWRFRKLRKELLREGIYR